MPSINNASATKALDEDPYINKAYDSAIEKQKNLLKENYTAAGGELAAEEQNVQQQAGTNLERANVEAQKIQQAYKGPKLSAAVQQQIALAMDNQQKKNATTVKTVQGEAEAEIERQRKLLGDQYAAAIKKAQADNDMARAQLLYEAAKAEDEQLLALKLEAGTRLAAKGDNSVINEVRNVQSANRLSTIDGSFWLSKLGGRETSAPDGSWKEVRKHEDEINKIYDSAIESDRQAAQMALNEALSGIRAAQEAETAAVDRNLTQTYVNALKEAGNYGEVMGSRGMGSGTAAQAQLARALGMTGDLTEQRGIHMGTAAKRGQQRFAAGQEYREARAKSVEANENKRVQALYKAAEEEEQRLITAQKAVGEALAQKGNYSVLGKLWGLDPNQVASLEGAGTRASSGGGTPGKPRDTGEDSAGDGGTGKNGTFVGADPSIMALGYGSISKQELAEKIASGEVIAVKNSDGSYSYVRAGTTAGSSVGAAGRNAAANGGKPLFVSASQKKSAKGGGSSTHTSSTGKVHGGGGGSFGSTSTGSGGTSRRVKLTR